MKVKLFKIHENSTCYYHECNRLENVTIFHAGDGWWEITDEEYTKLVDAVSKANRSIMNGNNWHDREFKYFLVEHIENMDQGMKEVFASAQEFIDNQTQYENEKQKRLQEEKLKKLEKAEQRKRKQLEKLKKELGEK